jgi:hypothetical protein
LVEADKFTVTCGGVDLGVVSEMPNLRSAISDHFLTRESEIAVTDGLFVGQPGGEKGAAAAWMLYESGDNLLRRSSTSDDIVESVLFHLASLEQVSTTELLPLRVKTIILPDGEVMLMQAAPVHSLAGRDRQLGRRGRTVLPSTLAIVDVTTAEVVLPTQSFDDSIPHGRFPIHSITIRETGLDGSAFASRILGLARSTIRMGGQSLDDLLAQIHRLAVSEDAGLLVLPQHEIEKTVQDLGHRERPRI